VTRAREKTKEGRKKANARKEIKGGGKGERKRSGTHIASPCFYSHHSRNHSHGPKKTKKGKSETLVRRKKIGRKKKKKKGSGIHGEKILYSKSTIS